MLSWLCRVPEFELTRLIVNKPNVINFDVFLTAYVSIMLVSDQLNARKFDNLQIATAISTKNQIPVILVINQLNAQILVL